MTPSLINADRSTHLKIVATALVAATLVVIVGLTARLAEAPSDVAGLQPTTTVVKAGSPVTVTSRSSIVR